MDIIKTGKFIAENRKKKNMTQEQLAEKLGVTSKTISRWENGNYMPDISLLKPLSDELGVSVNDLLSGEKIKEEDLKEKTETNILNTMYYSNKKIKHTKLIFISIISIMIIFAISLSVMYRIDINRMRNNQPVFFSTWGFDYASPIGLDEEKIEKTIKDYLIKKDEENKRDDNEKSFVAMQIYLIDEFEKRGKTIVYAWILQEKYYKDNNSVIQNSGSSVPYKIELIKDGDNYIIENYEIPRDGSYYTKDMENLFPNSVLTKMQQVDSDGTIEKLEFGIKEQVDLYFH